MGLRLSHADNLDQVVLWLGNWSRGSGMFNTPRDEIETTSQQAFITDWQREYRIPVQAQLHSRFPSPFLFVTLVIKKNWG